MDLLESVQKELRRRHYSTKTAKTYLTCLKQFLHWYQNPDPSKITKKDVQDYLYTLCTHNKAASTLNVHLQALKFACEETLHKRFFVHLPSSRVPVRLPVVMTKDEVQRLLATIPNTKHHLAATLLYAAGLRVSEAAHLKVEDLELDHGYGWVRRGKGAKDRLFIIAQRLNEPLKAHITEEHLQPHHWLFPGRDSHLSPRTLYAIIKHAAKTAGITKTVHPHTLRHSFATHLIEDGHDVTTVQALLGHASPETTMVYIHTATRRHVATKSPYDSLPHEPKKPSPSPPPSPKKRNSQGEP